MAVFLDFPRLHQLASTAQIQVYQTCPVGSIFAHVFSRRRFNELNHLDTSVVDVIGERFEVIVPYHGLTKQWIVFLSFLGLSLLIQDPRPPSHALCCLEVYDEDWYQNIRDYTWFIPSYPSKSRHIFSSNFPLSQIGWGISQSSSHLPSIYWARVVFQSTPQIASGIFLSHILRIYLQIDHPITLLSIVEILSDSFTCFFRR